MDGWNLNGMNRMSRCGVPAHPCAPRKPGRPAKAMDRPGRGWRSGRTKKRANPNELRGGCGCRVPLDFAPGWRPAMSRVCRCRSPRLGVPQGTARRSHRAFAKVRRPSKGRWLWRVSSSHGGWVALFMAALPERPWSWFGMQADRCGLRHRRGWRSEGCPTSRVSAPCRNRDWMVGIHRPSFPATPVSRGTHPPPRRWACPRPTASRIRLPRPSRRTRRR